MESEKTTLPKILFISSYPPRECGIATFSQDLIKALNNKFDSSFSIKVCALEANQERHEYGEEVDFSLNTAIVDEYLSAAAKINGDPDIRLVVIQHEFGFFHQQEKAFEDLLAAIEKPIVLVFHTVLSAPNGDRKSSIQRIASFSDSIVVMTHHSEALLLKEYELEERKVSVIPHGTHLMYHYNKKALKDKYGFRGRKVLSTFGLLSEGKNIESTLEALPAIIEKHPNVLFLVIGKTHPEVVKREGERYRELLEERVDSLGLGQHVLFVNRYLPLNELLNYLQLSDIYLFTSKDPEQAVSGTFAYAMSCACPIISTRIPHAMEILTKDTGIIVDFESPKQLEESVNFLLADHQLKKISVNVLQKIVPTAWENVVIAYSLIYEHLGGGSVALKWNLPPIKLDHIKRMTTDFGMIQFSKIDQPDYASGYTLDDNARALIVLSDYYDLYRDKGSLAYIRIYLNFIAFCQQENGDFLNYVDLSRHFTGQNDEVNLEDANGRAIWALGSFISKAHIPVELKGKAEKILKRAMTTLHSFHSPRAIAFAIKGLYFENSVRKSSHITVLIKKLANRLVQLFKHEAEVGWEWFEGYLTYANSVLPEALLCAFEDTGEVIYRDVAKKAFDFLLSKTFTEQYIKVVSNKVWLMKGEEAELHGQQPIDVAYTVLALDRFYSVFLEEDYRLKKRIAFEWFLGKNHLYQIVYNPCTGGCYDGLEKENVNLNQGAESTVSYLMARLAVVDVTELD